MAPRIPPSALTTLRTTGWTVSDSLQVAYRSDYSNRAACKCSRTINGAGDWALRHGNGSVLARGTESNAIDAALAAGDAWALWETHRIEEPAPWSIDQP
jgi:hypothetical protein